MRKLKLPPYPKRAHSSGKARITFKGHDYYLGEHGSKESWTEYRRLLELWQQDAVSSSCSSVKPAYQNSKRFTVRTVADLAAHFWPHAQQHYRRKDGTETPEVKAYQMTLRVLLRTHGPTPIADFGPVALRQVRQAMIDGSWLTADERKWREKRKQPLGWCRTQINSRINKIKHAWAWAVGQELIPVEAYQRLQLVECLEAGRSAAHDYDEVEPVEDAIVDKTLPFLGPVVSVMVQVQRLTGMRPGEICRLRLDELDRAGPIAGGVQCWVYRPKQHKSAHRGHSKEVLIGPRAQMVLTAFLAAHTVSDYLFSPSASAAAFHAARSLKRKTPAYPSHLKTLTKRKAQRRRVNFAPHFTVAAYGRRITAACKQAGVAHWHPHQLRHSAGTEVAEKFSLDDAQHVLGHRDPKITLRYAKRSMKRAAAIAAQIG